MSQDPIDEAFANACARLFHLHDNGYKRPKPKIVRRPPAERTPPAPTRSRVGASVI